MNTNPAVPVTPITVYLSPLRFYNSWWDTAASHIEFCHDHHPFFVGSHAGCCAETSGRSVSSGLWTTPTLKESPWVVIMIIRESPWAVIWLKMFFLGLNLWSQSFSPSKSKKRVKTPLNLCIHWDCVNLSTLGSALPRQKTSPHFGEEKALGHHMFLKIYVILWPI